MPASESSEWRGHLFAVNCMPSTVCRQRLESPSGEGGQTIEETENYLRDTRYRHDPTTRPPKSFTNLFRKVARRYVHVLSHDNHRFLLRFCGVAAAPTRRCTDGVLNDSIQDFVRAYHTLNPIPSHRVFIIVCSIQRPGHVTVKPFCGVPKNPLARLIWTKVNPLPSSKVMDT
jgi:hypothetical protein